MIYSLFFAYAGWFFSNQILLQPYGNHLKQVTVPQLQSGFYASIIAWFILLSGGFIFFLLLYTGSNSILSVKIGSRTLHLHHGFIKPIGTVLCIVILAFHFKICVMERVSVSGSSMLPTLKNGQTLWIEKLSTGFVMPRLDFPFGKIFETGKLPLFGRGLPKRGAVVIIHYPGSGRRYFIKRVIALPGDRYRFTRQGISINGVQLKEPYLKQGTITNVEPDIQRFSFQDFAPELDLLDPRVKYSAMNGLDKSGSVPPYSILALGDNRTRSHDSRSMGFIPIFYVIGTALD